MTPAGAQAVLGIIGACGLIAWMLALWGYGRMSAPWPGESEEVEPSTGVRRLVATWSRLVGGAPDDVAEGLLRVLGPAGSGGAAPVRMSRGADGCIVLERTSRLRLPSVPAFSRCEIRVAAAGAGSEIAFRADYSEVRRRARLWAAGLLALAAVVMVVLVGLLWLHVIPSKEPRQVFQAVHMIHFLWPPWLVYALHRYARRGTEAWLAAAAANASVLAEALAARRRKAGGG